MVVRFGERGTPRIAQGTRESLQESITTIRLLPALLRAAVCRTSERLPVYPAWTRLRHLEVIRAGQALTHRSHARPYRTRTTMRWRSCGRRLSLLRVFRARTGLSVATHTSDQSRSRRRRRFRGAFHRAGHLGSAGPADRDRQPARRRDPGTDRVEGARRRLHAHGERQQFLDRAAHARQHRLRSAAGLRADQHRGGLAEHPRHPFVGRGEHRERADRAGKGEAGRAELRVIDGRRLRASFVGAFQVHGGRGHRAHQLQDER